MSSSAVTPLEQLARAAASGRILDRLLHDLKQPLNVIRVVASDVRLDVKKSRLELQSLPERMVEIECAVDRAVGGIDRLRRLAGARPDMAPGQVDRACHRAAERVRLGHPSAALDLALGTSLPPVGISEPDLEQAIYELLDNGLRAAERAERGQPQAAVVAACGETEITVEVRDNGAGLPERLRRGAADSGLLEPESRGTGLMLARALVEEAGGRLQLADSDAAGTCFRLVLPRWTGCAS